MVISLFIHRNTVGHALKRAIDRSEIISQRPIARDDEDALNDEENGNRPCGGVYSSRHDLLVYGLSSAREPQKHRAIRIGGNIF